MSDERVKVVCEARYSYEGTLADYAKADAALEATAKRLGFRWDGVWPIAEQLPKVAG